jgi:hypothetical protein
MIENRYFGKTESFMTSAWQFRIQPSASFLDAPYLYEVWSIRMKTSIQPNKRTHEPIKLSLSVDRDQRVMFKLTNKKSENALKNVQFFSYSLSYLEYVLDLSLINLLKSEIRFWVKIRNSRSNIECIRYTSVKYALQTQICNSFLLTKCSLSKNPSRWNKLWGSTLQRCGPRANNRRWIFRVEQMSRELALPDSMEQVRRRSERRRPLAKPN